MKTRAESFREERRRFHWHQHFLALRRRDGELARYHRQIAQKLQGASSNFRQSRGKVESFDNDGRPGRGNPAAGRGQAGNPAVTRIAVSAGSFSSTIIGRSVRAARSKERTCRRCGCTQYNACEDLRLMDSCSWVELDLCSACLTGPEFKRFMAGIRKPSLGK